MSDSYADLEKELKGLAPARPEKVFNDRISKALGPQGEGRMSPQGIDLNAHFISFRLFRNLAVAASLLLLLALAGALHFKKQASEAFARAGETEEVPIEEASVVAKFPDSVPQSIEGPILPLRAPSTAMSSPERRATWQRLNRENVLFEILNDGVVHHPEQTPSQQFRYRYFDTATFTDPADNSKMRMTVPREQVIRVKLEPY